MLYFGTAGIPINAKTTEDSFSYLKNINLDAMELEFVRSVNLTENKANDLKNKAGIILSVHAPYYVNLNAKEPEKIVSSIKRIVDSSKILNIFNNKNPENKNVVFHPGYYLKENPDKVYEKIKLNMLKIIEILIENKFNVKLRPETTGKTTQFGSLDELIKLSTEINVLPCIDFSHVFARSFGKINDYNSFYSILLKLEENLGKLGIKDMHIHISGIEFGNGGEKNHLPIESSNFNYVDVLRALKDFDASGTVICESPKLEYDCLILKKIYEEL
ncbi:Xylose isomerase domain protein TIM barrel [Methanococcus vannielii SB]|uniref:Xylose isomerase domain protein TIM barrel n=1 Tax=Methanococcus vannielii (strain ATCC 35089 / DSM 1224 / JCM 13029 / OCM 148 / SB) TaxID=406327 RepID=A6UQV9_METVS|nr:TIM barrel protein [Methanococcus vannielii]ABR54881.1 Xylose isomerase domain protein TIM barrel [Methanococcus vannielii SB]